VAEKRVDLVYDRLGQRASLTRYADLDGTKYVAGTDYTFDELGRLTDLTHQRADTVFADYDFAWDKLGQLTGFDFDSLTGDDGQTDYTYLCPCQLAGTRFGRKVVEFPWSRLAV